MTYILITNCPIYEMNINMIHDFFVINMFLFPNVLILSDKIVAANK